MKKHIILLILILPLLGNGETGQGKDNDHDPSRVETNINGKGYQITIRFHAGEAHNYPSMAIWTETMYGEFIQPLFVTSSFGKGVYRYGEQSENKWKSGTRRYKAALPYFIHKWTKSDSNGGFIIPSPEQPVPDAYTAATPSSDFILKTKTSNKQESKFRIVLEINQAWDFNEYWHNARFPGNSQYKASCQPSLIYAVTIDTRNPMESYVMNPVGHGHYAGANGKMYTDLSTITTAKNIAERIEVDIQKSSD
ncbi:MAG: hypothetical protein ACLFM1_00375 [Bacteroidales bacterium]